MSFLTEGGSEKIFTRAIDKSLKNSKFAFSRSNALLMTGSGVFGFISWYSSGYYKSKRKVQMFMNSDEFFEIYDYKKLKKLADRGKGKISIKHDWLGRISVQPGYE